LVPDNRMGRLYRDILDASIKCWYRPQMKNFCWWQEFR